MTRIQGDHDVAIRIADLSKIYHTASQDYVALKDVSLEIHPGEFVCVVGRSGSGKSTLINMMTGIDSPSCGDIWVDDVHLGAMSENDLAIWRGEHVGIVFQFYQLLPMLSLLENVLLPMEVAGRYDQALRKERAMNLLARVDLSQEAHKRPGEVSGGQQQSAAIARALANDPPILIADEPTGNLDTLAAERIFILFDELAHAHKTVVMVTHDEEIAAKGDRVLRLSDGRLIGEDVRVPVLGGRDDA